MEAKTKKPKLPRTDSIQKLAELWDKHDLTDFEDELEEVVEPVFARRNGGMRLVRTDRFVVAVEVEAVIPDADPSEPCYEPHVAELLRQVEAHTRSGDDWLRQHGKVYISVEAA